jgi:hypothetical protein
MAMSSFFALSPHAGRSLLIGALVAAGAFAGDVLLRPAPSFEATRLSTQPEGKRVHRVTVPPPGDVHLLAPGTNHRTVVADLIDHGPSMPGCGLFIVWTPMVFADVYAGNATLPVVVMCASAGGESTLPEGHRFRVELYGPIDIDHDGKHDAAWCAESITPVESPAPQHPAGVDSLCQGF